MIYANALKLTEITTPSHHQRQGAGLPSMVAKKDFDRELRTIGSRLERNYRARDGMQCLKNKAPQTEVESTKEYGLNRLERLISTYKGFVFEELV